MTFVPNVPSCIRETPPREALVELEKLIKRVEVDREPPHKAWEADPHTLDAIGIPDAHGLTEHVYLVQGVQNRLAILGAAIICPDNRVVAYALTSGARLPGQRPRWFVDFTVVDAELYVSLMLKSARVPPHITPKQRDELLREATNDLCGYLEQRKSFRVHAKAPSWEPKPPPNFREPQKVGRNEQCPCGSGAKYKRCHGQ